MNEVTQVQMVNWSARIRQRNESGLTIKEWCAENNFSENTYYYWLKKLRKSALNSASAGNIDYQDTRPTEFAKVTAHPSSDVALRIHHEDTVIEVRNDASDRIIELVKDVMSHAF